MMSSNLKKEKHERNKKKSMYIIPKLTANSLSNQITESANEK
jgi:hypothetical protein